MLKLSSFDNVRADSFVFRAQAGAFQIVVCKLTVALLLSVSEIAESQEEVVRREQHWEGDPRRSVYRPLDLVPTKRRAEVMVVGHAYAASSEGATALIARVMVGSVDKAIEVHAPRRFEPDGSLREGARFQRSPIGWEHASGGAETENPIGVDVAIADSFGKVALPSLQPPGLHITERGSAIASSSFAPLSASSPRRARLARGGAGWIDGDVSADVWPDSADYNFFNAAPLDQQSDDAFRPDERIVLEHLDRNHTRLVTNLPGARPRAAIVRAGVADEIELTFDTIWIDTDRGLATLTFRGRLTELDDPRAVIAIALERAGHRFDISDLVARAAAAKASKLEALAGATVAGASAIAEAVLPFVVKNEALPPPRSRRSIEEIERLTTGTLGVAPMSDRAPVVTSERPAEERSVSVEPAPIFRPSSSPVAPPAVVLGAPREVSSVSTSAFAPQSSGFTPQPSAFAPQSSAFAPQPSAVDRQPTIGEAVSAMPEAATPVGKSQAPLPKKRARTLSREKSAPSARVELLWFDARSIDAIKRARKASARSDNDWITRDVGSFNDRSEAHEALRSQRVVSMSELESTRDEALDRGEPDPPVVLVAGELTTFLDERALLEATIAMMSPLGPTDKRLTEALSVASDVVKTVHLPTDMIATARGRLEEAFRSQTRPLALATISDAVSRSLIESRLYQRRVYWGEERARCMVREDTVQVPCYLPSSAASELPLLSRVRVRILAEIFSQQDAQDASPISLRPLALGRSLEIA